MRLRYLAANDLFALEALVDAGCSAVTDYRDVERPGAPRDRIANYTTLRMRLGGRTYLLDLGGGSDIRFDFVREGP
jgi:hypothetical protein